MTINVVMNIIHTIPTDFSSYAMYAISGILIYMELSVCLSVGLVSETSKLTHYWVVVFQSQSSG